MKLEEVKNLINLAKNEGLAELSYESNDLKVAFKLSGLSVIPERSQEIRSKTIAHETKPATNYHEIKSPFVGTFYLKPSPTEKNFVQVGDRVSKGQTLCILEAMKIMNEIEADTAGEVVEILLENESLVEYGQVLFRIRA